MFSLPYSVGLSEKARNYLYNGLSAIASLHVDLSKELQWFRCRTWNDGAKKQGITMV